MEYIVDRFENDTALLEPAQGTLRTVKVSRDRLPPETREGDVLVREGECWRVDAAATSTRRERLQRRFQKIGR